VFWTENNFTESSVWEGVL